MINGQSVTLEQPVEFCSGVTRSNPASGEASARLCKLDSTAAVATRANRNVPAQSSIPQHSYLPKIVRDIDFTRSKAITSIASM